MYIFNRRRAKKEIPVKTEMKNRSTATRNTCFAIISAIETDLRNHIVHECEIQGLTDILPNDIREPATRRWHADHSSSAQTHPESDFELIDYTDVLDLSKLLHRIANAGPETKSTIKALSDGLELVAPVRNRVCHSRPLEPEDLPCCVDLSDKFTTIEAVEFSQLKMTRTLLEKDPSYVLGLQIPVFWAADKTSIHHNLPLPEFDETGFLGRRKDRRELHKLLRSHYPVVTVVGEGGVGKTALTLRCLYDLLDDDEPPYDVIVWSSLKVAALTESGVVQLRNDVATTLNLLASVADGLGTPSSIDLSSDELFDEIAQYMKEFRVLVAIDNLETLASMSFRQLLLTIPPNSKLLITSRVGIGEFETRYLLESLDTTTAVELMRRFAHVLGVTTIYKAPESALRRYAKNLFHNPLLLKWFISGVARGLDPQSLLGRERTSFQEALKFCFANVFDKLDTAERDLIDTLVSARRPLTATEIYFLNPEAEHAATEWALGSLHNSSVVKRVILPDETFSYQLSEPAAAYVSSHKAPSRAMFNAVQARLRELRQSTQRGSVSQARYPYDIYSVRAHSRNERIAALLLSQALDLLRRKDLESARHKIQEAKRLLPTFEEAYRISSLIETAADELFHASEELDRAVDYAPNSTIVRYTYAQFLIRQLEDFDAALAHLTIAEKRDPQSPTLQSAKALVLSRLGRSAEAAIIYEGLLAEIAERPRRWRITTRDQSAECYRRWAETDLHNLDMASFGEHLHKALDLLSQAVENKDYDDKTFVKLGRTLQDGIVGTANAGDFAVAEQFIQRVESIMAKLLPQPIMILMRRIDHISMALIGHQDLIDRVMALSWSGPVTLNLRAEKLAGSVLALGSSRYGWIDNLPANVRYGFIKDSDENSWFFHYNHLVNENDGPKLSRGTEVKFLVGENDRGRCAVSVSLVSSHD